ncbi:MAG: fructosamine kinase family protein [Flavobacteriales bacterium]
MSKEIGGLDPEDEGSLEGIRSVAGGSINAAYRVSTTRSSYFLKVNKADRYPGMFEAEERGLRLLKGSGEIGVPEPFATGQEGNEAFILMECIGSGQADELFWERFGKELARMHSHTADRFGLDHSNYIGSLPQYNEERADWPSFFAEMRLEPQVRMAREAGKMDASDQRGFERLYGRLDSLFPEESPALIHGDLWSGNYMVDSGGEPCLVDPAVYYGHREMDLGMSTLFGRFGDAFYEAYDAENPLYEGWQERLDLSNLYPLMVHVNLFGGGFASEVRSILKRFS